MRRFEPKTPRAPAPVAQQVRAQRDVGADVARQPKPQPNFYQRVAGLFSNIRGPGYNFFGGKTRESLPVAGLLESGQPPSQFYGFSGQDNANIGLTPSEMFARNADPYKPTRGRVAFSALMSALSHGTLPPYISFAGQAYIGLSDDDLSQNYVKGANGWVRLERGQTATSGGGGGSDGGVDYVSYVPSYGGGGSSSTNRSGLVNWRI